MDIDMCILFSWMSVSNMFVNFCLICMKAKLILTKIAKTFTIKMNIL